MGSPPDGGCPPFEVIGLIKVTVILFQSGWYFRDHRVAPTEAEGIGPPIVTLIIFQSGVYFKDHRVAPT